MFHPDWLSQLHVDRRQEVFFFTYKSHWVTRSNPVNDIYFYLFFYDLHDIIVILNYMYNTVITYMTVIKWLPYESIARKKWKCLKVLR